MRARSDAQGHLDQLVVEHIRAHLLLRGGAVERDGRAVLVLSDPGRASRALVAALVRGGFDPLADALVAVDPATGQVTPHPWAPVPRPDDRPRHPARIDLVVVLDGPAPGGARTRVQAELLAPGQALTALLALTLGRTLEAPGRLRALADLVGQVPAIRLGGASLDGTVEVIGVLVAAAPTETATADSPSVRR